MLSPELDSSAAELVTDAAEVEDSVVVPPPPSPLQTKPPRPDLEAATSVLVPSIRLFALLARVMTEPETVISGPPGLSVCEPMRYSETEFAVMVDEPTTTGGSSIGEGDEGAVSDDFEEPTMRYVREALVCSAIGVVSVPVPIVIVEPPAFRVCEPTKYSDAEFAVMVEDPTTTDGRPIGGVVIAPDASKELEEPTTT